MRRSVFLAGLAWIVSATPVAVQNRPDFAGKWVLARDGAAADVQGAFGETFVAAQYATSVVIDWSFFAQGRGAPGKAERKAHSAFVFDGTESNVSDIYSSGSHAQIVDTSAWDGQKLVITTTWRGNSPAHVSRKRTLWLDQDGTLIVETSTPSDGGGPWATARSRYRRMGGTIEARPQAAAQVPVVSKDPAVQRQIEMQLTGAASVRLDPNARVASLSLTNQPLRDVLEAVAKEGGMTFRYAQGMVGRLSIPSAVTLSDRTVEDALRTVLEGHAMTFLAMGPKMAFIYPDTPADRDKYTASIRVFPIAKADPMRLAQQLNQALKPTADGFRPMVLTGRDVRAFVVRAVPEHMAWIATWIAQNDRD